MNSVFTIIFVLCALQVAASFRQSFGPSMSEESASMQLLRELQHNMMESAHRPMPRARRVPAPGETRACGRKLISLVMAVCGDLCNPQEGKDIATECCGNQCSDDYIRSACCP